MDNVFYYVCGGKMSKPLISVIIPVYNVEPYIHQCLDSVVNQTYENLEIILVDDGSKDNSGKICDEYALGDKRIVVIHQENAGLGMARNTGLNICTGKYLTFVDSDDYIDADMIQALFEGLCFYGSDMASCYYKKKLLLAGYSKEDYQFKDCLIYEDEEKLLFDLLTDYLPHMVWAKLFKREIFTTSRFAKVKMSEDVLIWLSLYNKIHKAVFLLGRKYNYVIRPDSLMSFNKFNTNMFDDLLVMKKLQIILPHVSKELGYVGERRYFNSIVHILQDFYRNGVCDYYAKEEKAYQREVQGNILHLLTNPTITVKIKLHLLFISIDLRLFYKVYGLYLKCRGKLKKI
jgi:glycosyltransferase involved in cell wall biosynthesis